MEASAVVPASMPPPYDLVRINVDVIQPSKTNPANRTKGPDFDELVTSVRQQGVLMPILLRPDGGLFQVVAGHRRLAAARVAGHAFIPAVVREMSESEALELQLIENLQRADLHPLEEAEGYRRLMQLAKLDAAGVSEHIGRSVAYVYDRVKLLELIPEARTIFLEGRILAGHAVILARLKAEDQKRTLKEGLFTHQELLFDDPRYGDKDQSKAVSAKELQSWVDDHIRFDLKSVDPMLFPDTALALEAAPKVVPITFSYMLRDSARDSSVRTYGEQAWKRADGLEKSKPCEHSVTGVVVAGARRGESFSVCVNKLKCTVHWADEVRARKSRVATAARGSSGGGGATPREAKTNPKLEKALAQARTEGYRAVIGAVGAAAAGMSAEKFLRSLAASKDWQFQVYAREHKISIPSGKAFAKWAATAPIRTIQEAMAYGEMQYGGGEAMSAAFGVNEEAILADHEQRARVSCDPSLDVPHVKAKDDGRPRTRKTTSLKPKKAAKKAASKKRSR